MKIYTKVLIIWVGENSGTKKKKKCYKKGKWHLSTKDIRNLSTVLLNVVFFPSIYQISLISRDQFYSTF